MDCPPRLIWDFGNLGLSVPEGIQDYIGKKRRHKSGSNLTRLSGDCVNTFPLNWVALLEHKWHSQNAHYIDIFLLQSVLGTCRGAYPTLSNSNILVS